VIDSHCHLTAPKFDADVEEVIRRAHAAGVRQILCVADAIEDIEPCLALARKHTGIFATAGVHPHHAKTFTQEHLDSIRRAAGDDRCKAIGEIGLDYHYMDSPAEDQKRVFEIQLKLAKELHLPAIVHCRNAIEDVWTIVDRVRPKKLVLHCCSERFEDVEQFIKMGYLLSFTGIITYPNTLAIRDTVLRCPLTQLMVETDAPFLAPIPYRGKRNEPALVVEIVKAIAAIKNVSVAEVDAQTTQNAVEFFSLPQ
jgi:TatD DNase family protein